MGAASSPSEPREALLELQPENRLDVIDVRRLLSENGGDLLARYPRALFVSYHTTAGYLDQRFSERLDHSRDSYRTFFRAFQRLFPPEAGYHHDRLHLRTELSEEQRGVEPRNADSHLTFISAGLRSCVTYDPGPDTPVWFVDLDGINGPVRRTRRTSVIGYHGEEVVTTVDLPVPVSPHPIDSVNLKDPQLGVFEQLQELVDRHEVAKGRIDISLGRGERHVGLTVNEYETLLMRHDLADILSDPFHFMAQKGRGMLRDPRAIPGKARDYLRYDGVQVLNEVMDILGMSESVWERILNRILAVPASRFLRMKRRVSLPVLDRDTPGRGQVVQGTYQSPILVQWKKAEEGARTVRVSLVRFV